MLEHPEKLPEVKAAARWWVDYLRGSVDSDSGNPLADVLKNQEARRVAPLDEGTLERYYEYLCLTIGTMIEPEHWRVDNPNWGSGIRVIANEYSPSPILDAAAQKAGIRDLYYRTPWKSAMWINPGEVKVRVGHVGAEQRIYPDIDQPPDRV